MSIPCHVGMVRKVSVTHAGVAGTIVYRIVGSRNIPTETKGLGNAALERYCSCSIANRRQIRWH